jgi:hypothetical protein
MPKHRPKRHKSWRHAPNSAPFPPHFYTIISAPAESRPNPQPVEGLSNVPLQRRER